MKTRIIKVHPFGDRSPTQELVINREWVPNEVGDLAIRFATHFGIVAAKTEGEDKAGRAKLELQTVEEIVQRSCDLAEKLNAELTKRGWILNLPDVPEDAPETKTDPPTQSP